MNTTQEQIEGQELLVQTLYENAEEAKYYFRKQNDLLLLMKKQKEATDELRNEEANIESFGAFQEQLKAYNIEAPIYKQDEMFFDYKRGGCNDGYFIQRKEK